MKKPHPFTACVRDNTKRFGEEGAKRVCATLKDIGEGTTHWREGHHSLSLNDTERPVELSTNEARAKANLPPERDWEQELYNAAEGNLEGLLEMHYAHMDANGDLKSQEPESKELSPQTEVEVEKPPAPAKSEADVTRDDIKDLLLEVAVGRPLRR